MIRLKAVTKEYPPEQIALKQIDLEIGSGEFVFVVGASGAGKSTLLRLLFAAEAASKGQVLVNKRNLASIAGDKIPLYRRDIGVIFQDYKLLTRRSVVDNVAFGLEVRGVTTATRKDLAKRLLSSIGLGERLDSMPLTLSGGEQQRVAVARALITKPSVILADEPTGNLDPEMSRMVLDLLLAANAAGSTVLVATHNLNLIEDLNLRTIVLDRGKIIGDFDNPRGLNA